MVIADSTLDKFYAEKMELVTRRLQAVWKVWTGVQGINLITLLWTEGDRSLELIC